jgi:cell wall-associated NlpC family hydrolase
MLPIRRIVRRVLFAILACSLATACAPRVRPRVEPPLEPAPRGSAAVSVARSLVGAPYLNSGATPDGFDCSGFVRYVFGELGITMPRSVREQASLGEPVDREHLRPGDLVFFAIDGHTISHVGIAVTADSFIHAPSSRGFVREESLDLAYWRTRFAQGRRVVGR